MKKKWIACCSQTGSEVLKISRAIGNFPDILLTNNSLSELNPNIFNYYKNCRDKTLLQVDVKITSKIYNDIFSKFKSPIITLNGWLKIIPADICDKYTIYNGHPGLISKYPELKGKDPVERVWQHKHNYTHFGSVIHLVTPEVDEGKIIIENSDIFDFSNFDEFDSAQRNISLNLWIKLLKKYI